MHSQEKAKLSVINLHLPSTIEEMLGIFLKEPGLFLETKRKLQPEMFGSYAWLFNTMCDLEEQRSLNFKAVVLLHPDQYEMLHYLRNAVVSVNRLPHLIQKLREEHLSNQMYNITTQYAREIYENSREPIDILSDLQTKIGQLTSVDAGELADSEQDLENWYKRLEEIMDDPSKAYGLLTGLEEVDQVTTGFQRTDFIVVGARTSIGKSAFMIDMVLRLAKNGYKTAIFSLEMSKWQLYLRMVANLLSIPMETLKTGQLDRSYLPRVEQAKEFLKGIYVDDTRGVSSEYITDAIRQLKRTRGLDFVVVDYIQDVKERGETNDNQGSALGRVCRKLRSVAQECDIALMGLSQVSRSVEERKDKRPAASDLSGSTGIETSADVIALLYRDEYYNPDTKDRNIMEINFAKQRNGKLGLVRLFYDKERQKLNPIARSR